MTEDNGAVFNNCGYDVSLEFDLPIDNQGKKVVTVRNPFSRSDKENTFSCVLYAYTGTEGSSIRGPTIYFTGPLRRRAPVSTFHFEPSVRIFHLAEVLDGIGICLGTSLNMSASRAIILRQIGRDKDF